MFNNVFRVTINVVGAQILGSARINIRVRVRNLLGWNDG